MGPRGRVLNRVTTQDYVGGGTGPSLDFLPQVLPCAHLVFLAFEVSSVACNQEPCKMQWQNIFFSTGEFYKVLLSKKKKKVVLIQATLALDTG